MQLILRLFICLFMYIERKRCGRAAVAVNGKSILFQPPNALFVFNIYIFDALAWICWHLFPLRFFFLLWSRHSFGDFVYLQAARNFRATKSFTLLFTLLQASTECVCGVCVVYVWVTIAGETKTKLIFSLHNYCWRCGTERKKNEKYWALAMEYGVRERWAFAFGMRQFLLIFACMLNDHGCHCYALLASCAALR